MTCSKSSVTPRSAPRVLIILLGAIGDVVRALPLLGRIREAWPQAYLAWAVEPKSEPILRAHPWLDESIIYDREHAPWSFIPFLRKIHEGHFDLVLAAVQNVKSLKRYDFVDCGRCAIDVVAALEAENSPGGIETSGQCTYVASASRRTPRAEPVC